MQVTVEAKALGESGVARHENFVVFVPLGVPGDKVEVRITEVKKKFAISKLLNVVEPSPARVASICRVFGDCGSCQWLNIRYEDQLTYKTAILRETLSRSAGVDPGVVRDMIGSPLPLGYRVKAQQMMAVREGKYEMGFYAYRSHRVVDGGACPLQADEMNGVFQAVRKAIELVKPSIFSPSPQPSPIKGGIDTSMKASVLNI